MHSSTLRGGILGSSRRVAIPVRARPGSRPWPCGEVSLELPARSWHISRSVPGLAALEQERGGVIHVRAANKRNRAVAAPEPQGIGFVLSLSMTPPHLQGQLLCAAAASRGDPRALSTRHVRLAELQFPFGGQLIDPLRYSVKPSPASESAVLGHCAG